RASLREGSGGRPAPARRRRPVLARAVATRAARNDPASKTVQLEREGRASPAWNDCDSSGRERRSALPAGRNGRFGLLDELGPDLLGPLLVDRLDRLLEDLLLVFGQFGDLDAECLDFLDHRPVAARQPLAGQRDLLLAGLYCSLADDLLVVGSPRVPDVAV